VTARQQSQICQNDGEDVVELVDDSVGHAAQDEVAARLDWLRQARPLAARQLPHEGEEPAVLSGLGQAEHPHLNRLVRPFVQAQDHVVRAVGGERGDARPLEAGPVGGGEARGERGSRAAPLVPGMQQGSARVGVELAAGPARDRLERMQPRLQPSHFRSGSRHLQAGAAAVTVHDLRERCELADPCLGAGGFACGSDRLLTLQKLPQRSRQALARDEAEGRRAGHEREAESEHPPVRRSSQGLPGGGGLRGDQPAGRADLGRRAHRRRGGDTGRPEGARGPGEHPAVRGGDEEAQGFRQGEGAADVLLDPGEVARSGVEAQEAALRALAQRDGSRERRLGIRPLGHQADAGCTAAQEPGLPGDAAAHQPLIPRHQHGAVGCDEQGIPIDRIQGEPGAQPCDTLIGREQALLVAQRQGGVAGLVDGLPQPRRDGGDVGARGQTHRLLRGLRSPGLRGRNDDQDGGREPRRGCDRHLQRVEESKGDLERLCGHPFARRSCTERGSIFVKGRLSPTVEAWGGDGPRAGGSWAVSERFGTTASTGRRSRQLTQSFQWGGQRFQQVARPRSRISSVLDCVVMPVCLVPRIPKLTAIYDLVNRVGYYDGVCPLTIVAVETRP
jgi:hypothetical protein